MNATLWRRLLPLTAIVVLVLPLAPLAAQDQIEIVRYPRPVVRVGQDWLLRAGDQVRHGVIVAGSAHVEGRVRGDLFVWLGDARLSGTAAIDGALVVIAGNIIIEPGAVVDRELVVVGGTITRPDTFEAGQEEVIVGFPAIGEAARALVPWVTDGLLLGRPLVPSLPWMRQVVVIAFVLGLVLTLVFHGPVKAAAAVVVERPLSVLMTGVLVLLLTGPLLVIVSATVVGLFVLPVVLCAMAVAWTIAKAGVARGIGHRLFAQPDPDSRPQSVRSFVLGFIVITAAYAVPLLGFVTWSLVSVFGLGAAFLTMTAALRREHPAKDRAPKATPPATPPPAGPTSPDAGPGTAAGPVAAEPAPEPPPASGLLAYPRAGFLDRAAAFALDCILVAMVTTLFRFDDEVYLFLLLAYFTGFWTWQGTSLGGIVVGLRVVRTDGSDLRFVDALVRALSSLFSFGVLAIGVLWMIQDPGRQTWHDKIAGTYVLKAPRDVVLAGRAASPHSS